MPAVKKMDQTTKLKTYLGLTVCGIRCTAMPSGLQPTTLRLSQKRKISSRQKLPFLRCYQFVVSGEENSRQASCQAKCVFC